MMGGVCCLCGTGREFKTLMFICQARLSGEGSGKSAE